MYRIGEAYDAPRPCPKCGHKKAIFRTTATDYGEWWKCVKCGNVFGTYEYSMNLTTVSDKPFMSRLTTLEEWKTLEKRVAELERKLGMK
jgi:ribosomal protein L37AE/L43A